MSGKLVVITGGMFSGKSSELIRFGERYALANRKVVYVKPSIDTRYSKTEIVTHAGKKVAAFTINPCEESLMDIVEADVNVLLIDEVQFFGDKLISEVNQLLSKGVTVYAAGLDVDFMFNGFGITMDLMARAEEVIKLKAVCEVCGADGIVSAKRKTNKSIDRVQLGEKENYIPLCRTCYEFY